MAFKFGKVGKRIEIGMHEGEIFDIRQLSCIRPNADFQIGKLFRERVAPCLGVADMFVEINDEQRHNRLLSHSSHCSSRNCSVFPHTGFSLEPMASSAHQPGPLRPAWCRGRVRSWPISQASPVSIWLRAALLAHAAIASRGEVAVAMADWLSSWQAMRPGSRALNGCAAFVVTFGSGRLRGERLRRRRFAYAAASPARRSFSSKRSTVRRMCRRAASVAMSTSALAELRQPGCWPSTTVLSSRNAAAIC